LNYDEYNREERYLCSHLFRLLHEPRADHRALRTFLGGIVDVSGFRIWAEVALIRDAYHERRNAPATFLDNMTRILIAQEGVEECRLWAELPDVLCNPKKTHPKQIKRKGAGLLSADEERVFGSMQGMFNAKPDLAIGFGHELIVYEAKFTEPFDERQLDRTRQIGEVWRELLFEDLGYSSRPSLSIRTLGMTSASPDVSWSDVLDIARAVYPEGDRSRQAFENAVRRFG
jgi:hypothetical protein